MNGGTSKWKDNLAAIEDHSAESADLADQDDFRLDHEKYTRQYVLNASKNAKYLLNQLKENLYSVCHASRRSVRAKAVLITVDN